MRCLYKFRSFGSISYPKKFLKDANFQTYRALIHSKPSNLRKTRKTRHAQMRIAPKERDDINSIFSKITEIIGTEIRVPDYLENNARDPKMKEHSHSSSTVCKNDYKSTEIRDMENLALEETNAGQSVVRDVSPIVQKITEIVRAENSAISMEEQLENSGFLFDPEIVEKVLKRCFKVGHLGLRFFNWLKLRAGYQHTTETYNTMIYMAGEDRDFGTMEKLVEQMEEASCSKDIKTWALLISSYGKGNMIGKALLVFYEMRKSGCEPDETAYKFIVSALCNAGKAEIATEFYKEMVNKGMIIDLKLYKLILNCLSRFSDTSAVRAVGNDMINVSQIPEQKVYSLILRSFCISGRIREALELLHELKDKSIMLAPENFEILVKGLCKNDRIADALEIVDIMKQSHVIDEKIYGVLINGYLRRDDISRALELFHRIKESGHVPLTSTYTELMQHLFRSNEYERACKLYEEMLEKGVEPDIVAITAVVAGHVQHNHITEAWKVFESTKDKGIKLNQKSYLVFVKELCKISRPNEALKVLNEMLDLKVCISDKIYHLVRSSFEKKRDRENIDIVKELWRASRHYIERKPASVTAYDVSLNGKIETVNDISEIGRLAEVSKSNQILQERAIAELMPKSYEEHDLQDLRKILLSSMDWSSMREALQKCTFTFTSELVVEILRSCQLYGHAALRFFSWVDQQPGYRNTTVTYNMAIKISGSAKDFEHMRKLYHEMKRRRIEITSDTWNIMIVQYGRVGLTEIALRKFKEMKAEGFKPTGSTYKFLVVFLCGKKGRKVDEAIRIFQEMINSGHVPDKELAEIYLRCLCETDKVLDARRCIKSLCKCGFKTALTYSLAIRAFCRAGRLEAALELADEIGESRSTLDQYIFGTIVHELLRRRRLHEALAKVDAMKQGGINPTVHVYTSFIVHFLKEKQIEKALETFKKMREEGCEPTTVTYSSLIRGYMDMGMVSDAWTVFRRMKLKGPSPDFRTYSMFIFSLCKQSRSEEALQLINEMMNSGILPSNVNFQTIFHGLNREGKRDLAYTVLQKKWELRNKRRILT